ncbi:MAG: hypothetical protein QM773_02495 [Hyphomonadaceae bacterium]
MRTLLAGLSFLALAACGAQEATDCCAKPAPPQAAAPAADPAPPAIDLKVASACSAGLVTRGLQEEELFVIMHEPAGVCPNMGVSEARIREIIAKDWDAAGCTQYTKEQMLSALNSGACGGDAG